MSLRTYKNKRHFEATPEPAGKLHRSKGPLRFVVQKHQASQLHYDLRLEMDGVLKSWAVPKGPSLDPHSRRLAMMTEDHPLEYRKFEGVIPEGNYGAGEVIIWDEGIYTARKAERNPEFELKKELKQGHITFVLNGKKLKGEFALIKNEKLEPNAWLLVKKSDRFAGNADITKQDKSVASSNRIEDLVPDTNIKNFPRGAMPKTVKPMLATLVAEAFDDEDWLFEIKWDGYRAIAAKKGKTIELYSRNQQDFKAKYSPVANAVGEINHDFVVDGEIVVVDKTGHSHFEWLQNWGREQPGNLIYYVFDLLWLDGHDLTAATLIERKNFLTTILPKNSIVRFSDHIEKNGKAFFKQAQRQSLEGIIAKQSASSYQIGRRTTSWLKIKTHRRQEAVIGGFTEPRGSRQYLGSLLLGVYKGKKLVYVGHSGGGFSQRQLKELRHRLSKLERKTSHFAIEPKPNSPVHWVSPKLVCEVSFAEWTKDGMMRHPKFEGLREDKLPHQVVKGRSH